MTIELSPQLEFALANEAARRGTTPQSLAVHLIESQIPAAAKKDEQRKTPPPTLFDRLQKYVGAVDSSKPGEGPSRISEDTGRRFTEILLERRRQGRL